MEGKAKELVKQKNQRTHDALSKDNHENIPAKKEIHTKSEIMNVSLEMRFIRGMHLAIPPAFWEVDVIIVRSAFFFHSHGYSAQKIAEILTEVEKHTKRGNKTWSAGSVLALLANESLPLP